MRVKSVDTSSKLPDGGIASLPWNFDVEVTLYENLTGRRGRHWIHIPLCVFEAKLKQWRLHGRL